MVQESLTDILTTEHVLLLSRKEGFPEDITLERHISVPCLSVSEFKDREYPFCVKGEYHYLETPGRVFLAERQGKRKLYWGHAQVISQHFDGEYTKGKFKITKIYSPLYQMMFQMEEVPMTERYKIPKSMQERLYLLVMSQFRTIGSVMHRNMSKEEK